MSVRTGNDLSLNEELTHLIGLPSMWLQGQEHVGCYIDFKTNIRHYYYLSVTCPKPATIDGKEIIRLFRRNVNNNPNSFESNYMYTRNYSA